MATNIDQESSKIVDESSLLSQTSKVSSVTTTERSSIETDSRDSLSTRNQMISAKAELGEVREENGRLKLVLTQIMKDYRSLQQENIKKYEQGGASLLHKQYDDNEEPDQLVALSLGRSSLVLEPKSKELKVNKSTTDEDIGKFEEGLALRLDGKYDSNIDSMGILKHESSGKSFNEVKELEDPSHETGSPSKKSVRNGDDDDEVMQQNPPKKARVSVRAICSAPTMNDGCQWRKYGQKISKGNPCPRAYYRCTVSPSCPVRKHVQRCAEDTSVLVTTYEGTHNHPLPPSATAMASTTSAAVTMLRSSSSTSLSGGLGATTSANLHGLNSYIRPNNSFYIPNTATTISTSQLHPTITLDLTTPIASSHYNKYASTFLPSQKYSPTCLNFSSANSSSLSSLEYWGALPNSKNLNGSSYVVPSYHQPYYTRTYTTNDQQPQYPQQCMNDKIAAATKEITSSPTFQSALAAAITSIVGKRAAGVVDNGNQKVSGYNGVGCATSYLNRSVVPSNSQQAGNLSFSLPPVFPFSSNKGPFVPSDHPTDKGEQNK